MAAVPFSTSERRTWICLLALVWVAGLGLSFWDQDEAAYAGFAWRMLETGDWLVPSFPWSEIHRKPPLHFWGIAASFGVFGPSEWAMRLPALLASLGTLLLVRYRAGAVFGEPVARVAAWILAANLFLPHLVKISVTDAPLLFFETLAVLSLVRFLHEPRWQEQAWFVVGVAGALLVKGPPVLILTLGMLGILFLLPSRRERVISFHPWLLIPLAFVPLVAWGRMAWIQDDGAFIRWMLDWYGFRRVSSDVLGQTGPPGYFLATLLVAFLPFVALLPTALGGLVGALRNRSTDLAVLVLAAWLASGWLIYEFMGSKLPAYAVGAYPAVALLLARTFVDLRPGAFRERWGLRLGLGVYVFLGLALAVALVVLALFPGGPALFTTTGKGAAVLMGAGLLGSTVGVAIFLRRSSPGIAFRLMLSQSVLFLGLGWFVLLPDLEPLRGAGRDVATWIAAQDPSEPVLLSRNFGLPSLPLYLEWLGVPYEADVDPDTTRRALETGSRLVVLDSRNAEEFRSGDGGGDGWTVLHERAGWISDRGRHTTWYVVVGGTREDGGLP